MSCLGPLLLPLPLLLLLLFSLFPFPSPFPCPLPLSIFLFHFPFPFHSRQGIIHVLTHSPTRPLVMYLTIEEGKKRKEKRRKKGQEGEGAVVAVRSTRLNPLPLPASQPTSLFVFPPSHPLLLFSFSNNNCTKACFVGRLSSEEKTLRPGLLSLFMDGGNFFGSSNRQASSLSLSLCLSYPPLIHTHTHFPSLSPSPYIAVVVVLMNEGYISKILPMITERNIRRVRFRDFEESFVFSDFAPLEATVHQSLHPWYSLCPQRF